MRAGEGDESLGRLAGHSVSRAEGPNLREIPEVTALVTGCHVCLASHSGCRAGGRSRAVEHLADFLREHFGRERLLQVLDLSSLHGIAQDFVVGVAGHEEHGQVREIPHDPRGQFAPAHFRHDEIGDDQADVAILTAVQDRDGLRAILGGDDVVAEALQNLDGQLAQNFFVLDDKNRLGAGRESVVGGALRVGTDALPTAGKIDVKNPISATTGANGGSVTHGGKGRTVHMVSSDTIDVQAAIKISDSAPGRASKQEGNIRLDSRKTSGTAINVTSSGQLLSLLAAAAPGAGGKVEFVSAGGDILVNGSTVQADKGTVDIRNNGTTTQSYSTRPAF